MGGIGARIKTPSFGFAESAQHWIRPVGPISSTRVIDREEPRLVVNYGTSGFRSRIRVARQNPAGPRTAAIWSPARGRRTLLLRNQGPLVVVAAPGWSLPKVRRRRTARAGDRAAPRPTPFGARCDPRPGPAPGRSSSPGLHAGVSPIGRRPMARAEKQAA